MRRPISTALTGTDGWYSKAWRRLEVTGATIRDAHGRLVGRIDFDGAEEELLSPRWKGQPHRLEVWYTTLTDPVTGTGIWIHHELVAPADGSPARCHGWIAVFPPDEPPVMERFGPEAWHAGGEIFRTSTVVMTPLGLSGQTGRLSWDLTQAGGGPPLYTFPRWAWRRELLPAAQIVPAPSALFSGVVGLGERGLRVRDAPGATAHIYGHGNAARWGWLHADLGGGDVLEIVAAVSTRPGLNLLAPLPMVRLRVDGADWPGGDPLWRALRFRADLGLPAWRIRGRVGNRRLSVEVVQPRERTVSVDYADPDGAAAVCHNSERAEAAVLLERRGDGGWRTERQWHLPGTAHAEIGLRRALPEV